jgi:16S rRNA processing protein RimM
MQITRDSNVPEGYVALAKITGIFGIKGELRVFLFNSDSTLLRKWRNAALWNGKSEPAPIRIKTRSGAGKKVIATIEGVDTPEQVRQLMEQLILFEKRSLPQTGSDEWYHHDIIGLPVYTESGSSLGVITEIVPGQVDIWVAEGNGMVIHIPNTSEDILEVDLNYGVTVPDEDTVSTSSDDED